MGIEEGINKVKNVQIFCFLANGSVDSSFLPLIFSQQRQLAKK